MIAYLRQRPMVAVVVIFVAFFAVGLFVISGVAREARRVSCRSSLEERVVLGDFLAYARSRNPSSSGQDFLRFYDQRLAIVPEVCDGTGVDVDAELERIREGRPPLPPAPTSTSPATVASTPTTVVRGPPGPPGRDGRDATPPTTSPPTSTTTTTTTPRRGRCVADVCIGGK